MVKQSLRFGQNNNVESGIAMIEVTQWWLTVKPMLSPWFTVTNKYAIICNPYLRMLMNAEHFRTSASPTKIHRCLAEYSGFYLKPWLHHPRVCTSWRYIIQYPPECICACILLNEWLIMPRIAKHVGACVFVHPVLWCWCSRFCWYSILTCPDVGWETNAPKQLIEPNQGAECSEGSPASSQVRKASRKPDGQCQSLQLR